VNTRGFTLLEAMVALVILGLVSVGFLDLFASALRAAHDARLWSQAVAYAEDAMGRVKIEPGWVLSSAPEPLDGGFERHVETRPWRDGLLRVTVVVSLPGGGSYDLDRLVRSP
jgi:prepilin-type N-terminal cleavage/methylation domain-containing protein